MLAIFSIEVPHSTLTPHPAKKAAITFVFNEKETNEYNYGDYPKWITNLGKSAG